jgi:hypothetical protein
MSQCDAGNSPVAPLPLHPLAPRSCGLDDRASAAAGRGDRRAVHRTVWICHDVASRAAKRRRRPTRDIAQHGPLAPCPHAPPRRTRPCTGRGDARGVGPTIHCRGRTAHTWLSIPLPTENPEAARNNKGREAEFETLFFCFLLLLSALLVSGFWFEPSAFCFLTSALRPTCAVRTATPRIGSRSRRGPRRRGPSRRTRCSGRRLSARGALRSSASTGRRG